MDKEDKIILPIISEEERTPLVDQLLDIIRRLQKRVENLDSEVKRLKKNIKGNQKYERASLVKKRNLRKRVRALAVKCLTAKMLHNLYYSRN